MQIIEKSLEELREYDNNPRNNDGAVEAVAESIKQFGFKVPIIIDKDGVIIAGHTRRKAAEKLGLETVPCVIADDLTEEQIKAFRLADNKVSEFATWDFAKLNEELEKLNDIDMSVFGLYAEDFCLDVDDDSFLQDTEVTKEKKKKVITCPHCGEEFEV